MPAPAANETIHRRSQRTRRPPRVSASAARTSASESAPARLRAASANARRLANANSQRPEAARARARPGLPQQRPPPSRRPTPTRGRTSSTGLCAIRPSSTAIRKQPRGAIPAFLIVFGAHSPASIPRASSRAVAHSRHTDLAHLHDAEVRPRPLASMGAHVLRSRASSRPWHSAGITADRSRSARARSRPADGRLPIPPALRNQCLLAFVQPAAVRRATARGRLGPSPAGGGRWTATGTRVFVDAAVLLCELDLQRRDPRHNLGPADPGQILASVLNRVFSAIPKRPAKS